MSCFPDADSFHTFVSFSQLLEKKIICADMVCIANGLDLFQRERLLIVHLQIHIGYVDSEQFGYFLLPDVMFSTEAFELLDIHIMPPSLIFAGISRPARPAIRKSQYSDQICLLLLYR
jgi:hypothetical protein